MMHKIIILLAIAIPTVAWHGTSEDVVRRPIHLRQRAEEIVGFAQAYQVGSTVYVSGLSGKGQTVGAQLRNAYTHLQEILDQVGAEPSHVVKETLYTTKMSGLVSVNDVRKAFYTDHLPACTFIGVAALMRPNYMVGIEAVIELP
jgi:enamine deaminase RidA (YjgF/YER057c/UK114 family)